jgi:hypothetical protein
LPPAIVAAINRQTQQFYEIQEFKYRVEREAQESTRKQVEANGIAAFQRIVGQGISESYLRWRGIEATLALAQSPNSKVVIIGSGKDGLPIILGNMDNSAATQPKPEDGASVPGKSSAIPSIGGVPADPKPTIGEPPALAGKDDQPGPNAQFDLSRLKAILPSIPEWLNPTTGSRPAGSPPPRQE